ncbi:MAG: hypothetical protein IIU28_06790 [Lachnospiraceae bacterium]|nr:hypothetical protein [Lachnospiraceae bacterium]
MRKVTKKIVSMALTAAMALSVVAFAVPTVKAEAATKTYNVFVEDGGVELLYFGDTVTSVSSTNSKVVKVKKDKTAHYKAIALFKKAGKATVTVRVKGYRTYATKKYSFNVKKASSILKPSMKAIKSSSYTTNVLVSVKNNSKINFDSVKLSYSFKDSAGNTIETDTTSVFNLGAKKTGYASLASSNSRGNVDLSRSSIKVTSLSRAKALGTGKTVGSGSYIAKFDPSRKVMTFKNKNYKKTYLTICAYIIFYDENGEITEVQRKSWSLKKGEVQTSSVYEPYGGYSNYKVVTNAYASK